MRDSRVEIRPTRGVVGLGLRELWTYRDLIYFFVWRDVKVRYKQTLFGAAWAIIQPLVLMVVFTFVFGRVLQVATPPGIPKPVFYYAGLVPWTLFATSLTDASSSLVTNATLVRKIYFPRLILPISAVGSSLVDFLVALMIVFVLTAAYGLGISWRVLTLPLLTLFAVLTALAFGMWVSALNARYRDVRYAIPFLVQVLLFLTPVFFSASRSPCRCPGFVLPESDGGCRRRIPMGSAEGLSSARRPGSHLRPHHSDPACGWTVLLSYRRADICGRDLSGRDRR